MFYNSQVYLCSKKTAGFINSSKNSRNVKLPQPTFFYWYISKVMYSVTRFYILKLRYRKLFSPIFF